MGFMDSYNKWLDSPYVDEDTKEELRALSKEEIEDRFYKSLEFGTAGLRGKLGAGTNRFNKYNVAQVTQGIANYIIERGQEYMNRGVAIAYDCRHFSDVYSKMAGLIFAANGIKAYWYSSLRPTPQLSYTIRTLGTASGVMMTASHNPKDYNGYKVYWDDGAQVLDPVADAMTEHIKKVPLFTGVKIMDEKEAIDKGLFVVLDHKMDDKYINMVKGLSIKDEGIDKSISLVYTPLNGAGSESVQRVLRERGFKNLHVVEEQKDPDPDFTTVPYPNPEDPKAFALAEKLGYKVGANLLLATDPDCDRVAIEVLDEESNKYIPLNGNQIGALLIKYIFEGMKEMGSLPEKPAIVKSIVTGDLGKSIGESYGAKTFNALTGFKNICGRIPMLEENGYTYVFGYEESIGYTKGTSVRDKDAVSSTMLLCEAAAYYKTKGLSMLDVLKAIFEEYGYYKEKVISLTLEGVEGSRRIGRMMNTYKTDHLKEIGDLKLSQAIDYNNGYEDIPASNVLEFRLDDGSWYTVRPSGTEPKIKIYIYSKGATEEKANENIAMIEKEVLHALNSIK